MLIHAAFADQRLVRIDLGSSSPNNQIFFYPSTIPIFQRDSVTWINGDNSVHRVVSMNASEQFDKFINPGSNLTHSFNKVGVFHYYCTIYPYMTGTVIVSKSNS